MQEIESGYSVIDTNELFELKNFKDEIEKGNVVVVESVEVTSSFKFSWSEYTLTPSETFKKLEEINQDLSKDNKYLKSNISKIPKWVSYLFGVNV